MSRLVSETEPVDVLHEMRIRSAGPCWVATCTCENFRSGRAERKSWVEAAFNAHLKAMGGSDV